MEFLFSKFSKEHSQDYIQEAV